MTRLVGVMVAREVMARSAVIARLAEWIAVYCDGRKDQHPLNKTDTRLPPG